VKLDGDPSRQPQASREGQFECVLLGVEEDLVQERFDEADVGDEEVDELDLADLGPDVDEVMDVETRGPFLPTAG
jgi:hypothetical protein